MTARASRCYASYQVAASGISASFAAALLLAIAAPAAAQAPSDVPIEDAEAASRPLPPLPDGFGVERRGDVRWEFPARAASIVDELQEAYRDEWPRVTAELGGSIDDRLVIRIGTNPEEMQELAPRDAPPPPYASGVAYPARGLVILTLTAPDTWERPNLEAVLVHELSHIALHRAVGGHRIPRWFSEGVAIHQAREHSIERVQTLWSATVGDRLLPLRQLSRAFSDRPHRVSLAYAESADFVRWLRAREDGDERFHELIDRLRDGQPFETSVRRTYSMRLSALELEWRANLAERFEAWPLLLGSGGLWVLAALLIVLAYFRRRRKDKKKIDEWEREERAVLAAAHVATTAALTRTEAREPEEEREVLYVLPPEPRIRDSGVPTIEHEGRSHTLH